MVAVALIGGAGLILLKRKKQTWTVHETKLGGKVLSNFRFNDVATIHIKGTSDVNVERKDGFWRVRERYNYPANFRQVSDFLIKIRDLKIVQSEPIGASQLAYVDLDEPGKNPGGGTLLEFKDEQGKGFETLLIGKKHTRQQTESSGLNLHGLFDGRYILLPSNAGNVLLISDELSSVASEPETWLNRNFFKVEKIKSISLTSTNAANSWSFSRENDSSPWVLAGSKPDEVLNTNLATQTAEMLEFPSFVDVLPSQVGLDKSFVVKIETLDHFAYTLKIGEKMPNGFYPMTVNVAAEIASERFAGKDEKPADKENLDKEFQENTKKLHGKLAQEQTLAPWIYVVDSWVEPLLRNRAEILQQKILVSEQDAVNQ